MNTRGLIITTTLVVAALAGLWLQQQSQRLPEDIPTAADVIGAQMTAGQSTTALVPAFELFDVNGEPHALADWSGQPRIVNFWATWCAPCRREIPLLKQLQASHDDINLQVIGVAVDDVEPVIQYAAETQFNYPVLVGQEDAMEAAEAFGVEFLALPFTFVVAADGELLATHIGELLPEDAELIIGVLHRLRNGEIDNPAARELLAGS
jgi:thiol-disulfide isomerase/thioredoxin